MEENNSKSDLPPDAYVDLDPNIVAKAKEGDPLAQLYMGKCYYSATDQHDILKKACYWFMLAAQQQNMEAQYRLGNMYALGLGIEKDEFAAYEWYTKSALQRYPKALLKIHQLYHENDKSDYIMDARFYSDTKKEEINNLPSIKQYFSKEFGLHQTPNAEDGRAQERLGFLYQHGFCVKKNSLLAIEYYEKAVKSNLIGAQVNLGYLYQHHERNEFSISAKGENYRKAFHWYELAAKNSNSVAQNHLGYMYFNGFGVKENPSKAVELYKQSALNGNLKSQITLAKMYRVGKFVPKSLTDSMQWYTMASEQGSEIAKNCLDIINQGIRVNQGDNIKNGDFMTSPSLSDDLCLKLRNDFDNITSDNERKKLKSLIKNALAQDGASMFCIGLNYYDGIGFPKNEDVGLKWITKAAKTGDHEAQYKLGKNYEDMAKGEHTDTDSLVKDRHFLNASIWYKKAAIQNNYKAQCSLGLLCENGLGVKKDLNIAECWYTKSAKGGNSDGQYHLGMLIFSRTKPENNFQEFKNLKGTGQETETEINMKKAISLIRESSDQDHPEANYMMGLLHESSVRLPLPKNNAIILINQDPQSAKKYYERAIRIYKERANSSASSTSILTTIYTDDLFLTNISFQNNADRETSTITTGEHSLDSKCGKAIILDKLSSIRFDKDDIYILEFCYKKSKRKEIVYGSYHPEILIFSENKLDIELTPVNQPKDNNIEINSKEDKNNQFNFVKLPCNKYPTRDDYALNLCKKVEKIDDSNQSSNIKVKLLIRQGSRNTKKSFHDTNVPLKKRSVSEVTAAQLSLAKIYSGEFRLKNVQLQNNIVQRHNMIATEYYQMASNDGDPLALYEYACFHLKESKTKRDYEECYNMLQKAAETGSLGAKNILNHQIERFTSVNSDQFVQMLLNNADMGISSVEYQLGYLYEHGGNIIGSTLIKQSYPQAIKFYEKAAAAGSLLGQYQLGCIYEKGNRVSRNLQKAFDLFEQASKNGHIDSTYKIANVYYKEQLGKKDIPKAFKLYRQAAEGGNLYAKEALDIDVDNNLYDRDNFLKKLNMYEAAAEQDTPDNFYRLGLVYEDKNCPFYDMQKAIGYYFMALEFNIMEAHDRLAILYEGDSEKEPMEVENTKYLIQSYQENINIAETAIGGSDFKKAASIFGKKNYSENYESAFDHLTKASELGHIWARETLNLSHSVYTATKAYISHEKIIEMYRTLAYQGNTIVQHKLGTLYEENKSMQNYSMALLWYSSAAKTGHKGALYRLGKLYQEGKGVQQNIEEAISLYIKAAETGCENSLSQLGRIFKDRREAKVNLKDQMNQRQKLALTGDETAQYILGHSHLLSDSSQQNVLEALKWFTKSYLLGNDDAKFIIEFEFDDRIDGNQFEKKKLVFLEKLLEINPQFAHYEIANLHYNRTSSLSNLTKAFKNYWKAAKLLKFKEAEKYIKLNIDGEPLLSKENQRLIEMFTQVANQESENDESRLWISEAQYQLGAHSQQKYKQLSGRNGNNTYLIDATRYFQSAAKRGHVTAEYELSMIYLEAQEFDRAKHHLENATSKQHSEAAYQLGKLYFDREQDFENGLHYLEESAELGNPTANNELGLLYKNGAENLLQDYKLAFKAFQKAAEKGHPESQFNLAFLYQTGQGTGKNVYLALKWYEKSAQSGNKQAGYQAAMMYMKGEGTSQNKELAQEYLKKYADNDDPEVIYYLSQLNEQKGDTRISLLKESARAGNHKAQYELGMIYLMGDGVVQDYNEAFNYLYDAANNENAEAKAPLGWLYENEKGTQKNVEGAIDCYKHSNQSESKEIQYRLGVLQKYRSPSNYEKMFLHLTNAADKGHSEAKYQLGIMYEEGLHVDKDHSTATRLYHESSERGITDADYRLGSMYMNVECAEHDYSKAIQHFLKFEDYHCYHFTYSSDTPDIGLFVNASSTYTLGLYEGDATVENIDSRYKLASIYKSDESRQNNPIISRGFLFQAALNGHMNAVFDLGVVYLKEKNLKEAIRWLDHAASHENLRAKNILGIIYMNNKEVPQDISKAMNYFKDAATLGDIDAQFNLGSIFYYGKGAEKDTEEAIKWYSQSADQGCIASQFSLGLIHKSGEDYLEAFSYFKKAADQNHSDSQYFLGWMYENGFGTGKDIVQANYWYKKSKIQESRSCSIFLAELYHCTNDTATALKWYNKALDTKRISFAERGMGLIREYGHLIERDYEKAFQLYKKSAKRGNKAACYDLGRVYYYGKGVEKDTKEAINWFKKASSNSHDSVTKHIFANIDSDSGVHGEDVIKYSIESEQYIAMMAKSHLDKLDST